MTNYPVFVHKYYYASCKFTEEYQSNAYTVLQYTHYILQHPMFTKVIKYTRKLQIEIWSTAELIYQVTISLQQPLTELVAIELSKVNLVNHTINTATYGCCSHNRKNHSQDFSFSNQHKTAVTAGHNTS